MAQIIQDYEYDVFISYPHQEEHSIWVNDIFLNVFKLHLVNELGRPVQIFFDHEGIGAGDAWPERLKRALACSRILLPVWSMNYFLSDWCMAESAVMFEREQKLGYRTTAKPDGLILPVKLFDGVKYPPFAKKIEPLDCTDYNVIGPDYKKTQQYFDLQSKLKKWVPQVAERIDKAPDWSANWLTEDWLDKPIKQWIADPSFQFPRQPFRAPTMGAAPAQA